MYAVIETGGKQYRVELGSEIAVERLDGDPGQVLEFERVLLVADDDATAIGQPLVEGARVSASVVRQDRADKVVVFKYKPKARRRVKHGHRQDQTVLRIADIVYGNRSAAKLADAARTERQRLEEAAADAAKEQAAADRALADQLARQAAEAAKVAAEGGEGETSAAPARRRRGRAAARTETPETEATVPQLGEEAAQEAAEGAAEAGAPEGAAAPATPEGAAAPEGAAEAEGAAAPEGAAEAEAPEAASEPDADTAAEPGAEAPSEGRPRRTRTRKDE